MGLYDRAKEYFSREATDKRRSERAERDIRRVRQEAQVLRAQGELEAERLKVERARTGIASQRLKRSMASGGGSGFGGFLAGAQGAVNGVLGAATGYPPPSYGTGSRKKPTKRKKGKNKKKKEAMGPYGFDDFAF